MKYFLIFWTTLHIGRLFCLGHYIKLIIRPIKISHSFLNSKCVFLKDWFNSRTMSSGSLLKIVLNRNLFSRSKIFASTLSINSFNQQLSHKSVYWVQFYQHFTSIFCAWRSPKCKKTLMRWLSFLCFWDLCK